MSINSTNNIVMKQKLALLTALLIAPLASLHSADASAPMKPNIIFIMADDLGYGDVSIYGSTIQTPNIDQLAKDGLKFTDFHSNGPNCSPTRCAFMTGRYQNRAGIASLVGANTGLAQDEFTLAEAMKSAGYATAMFGKWHLGELPKFNPTMQGFDEFKGHLTGRINYFTHCAAGGDNQPDWWNGCEPLVEEGCSTTLIANHSIDFIRRSKSEPFFLYVAFNAPHTPILDPETGEKSKTAETYGKVVQDMDRNIGRIIATLKELGLNENTLVFFCSDNGAPHVAGASNGKLNGFKGSFWEGGHRVPGIAWWPGRIAAGKSTDQTAMIMDLMPTFMELAGTKLPPANRLDGVSLAALLLNNQPLAPRNLFWCAGSKTAMRNGPWKLLVEKKEIHLFDLNKDLFEKYDLAAQRPERVQSMKAELIRWVAEVEAGKVVKKW
jgi:arylsulfatase A-like enzyme